MSKFLFFQLSRGTVFRQEVKAKSDDRTFSADESESILIVCALIASLKSREKEQFIMHIDLNVRFIWLLSFEFWITASFSFRVI